MQNDNFIPEAFEPETHVDGKLVPADAARAVRRGWQAGIAYIALQLLASIVVFLDLPEVSLTLFAVAAAEVAVVSALVYGLYRWNLVAAWLLFLYPLASTLAVASFGSAGRGGTQVRVFFLVVFGVLFGRAALSVGAFRAKHLAPRFGFRRMWRVCSPQELVIRSYMHAATFHGDIHAIAQQAKTEPFLAEEETGPIKVIHLSGPLQRNALLVSHEMGDPAQIEVRLMDHGTPMDPIAWIEDLRGVLAVFGKSEKDCTWMTSVLRQES